MQRKDITDYFIIYTLLNSRLEKSFISIISDLTASPWKVAYKAIERCFNNGYINYGTSLNFPFITDKGFKYLNLNR